MSIHESHHLKYYRAFTIMSTVLHILMLITPSRLGLYFSIKNMLLQLFINYFLFIHNCSITVQPGKTVTRKICILILCLDKSFHYIYNMTRIVTNR